MRSSVLLKVCHVDPRQWLRYMQWVRCFGSPILCDADERVLIMRVRL